MCCSLTLRLASSLRRTISLKHHPAPSDEEAPTDTACWRWHKLDVPCMRPQPYVNLSVTALHSKADTHLLSCRCFNFSSNGAPSILVLNCGTLPNTLSTLSCHTCDFLVIHLAVVPPPVSLKCTAELQSLLEFSCPPEVHSRWWGQAQFLKI